MEHVFAVCAALMVPLSAHADPLYLKGVETPIVLCKSPQLAKLVEEMRNLGETLKQAVDDVREKNHRTCFIAPRAVLVVGMEQDIQSVDSSYDSGEPLTYFITRVLVVSVQVGAFKDKKPITVQFARGGSWLYTVREVAQI